MTTLPEVSELQKLVNEAMAIYGESRENENSSLEDTLLANEEKYARIYELREPFEETKLYIEQHPKRGLFSNPYKQHKKAIKDFESILFSLYDILEIDKEAIDKQTKQKEHTNAFKATLLSNTNMERLRQNIYAQKQKHNTNAKAMANLATLLRDKEAEEANAARKRMAERLRNLDARYNASMKKGGAKKTRKMKKRSKKTRKH